MSAGSSTEPETQYVKKGIHENPVVPCKGWFDSCEYCDKRFCKWTDVYEDIYEKIPEKPGFFMVALKHKNITEVVNILYDETNIQKLAISSMDEIHERISNKKNKASKSVVLVRWMIINNLDDKENGILCAHWYNNGVLPKFSLSWPGQNLMCESTAIAFAKQNQKWCYAQKNPIWRKPKPPSTKCTEEVKKCNFQSCKICDSYFTQWQCLPDVIVDGLAPEDNGLVMLSAVYGKSREVLLISNDKKHVVVPIKSTIKTYDRNRKYYLRNSQFANTNASLQVRWAIMNDTDSDNSCYLYAHWYNADSWPKLNDPYMWGLVGKIPLNKNKHFLFHMKDKKWFYETETLKPGKFSKAKKKKQILDELNAEDYYEIELPDYDR